MQTVPVILRPHCAACLAVQNRDEIRDNSQRLVLPRDTKVLILELDAYGVVVIVVASEVRRLDHLHQASTESAADSALDTHNLTGENESTGVLGENRVDDAGLFLSRDVDSATQSPGQG